MSREDDRRQRLALGDLLRDLRTRAGLRQVDVAKALGIPQSVISKYESGERRMDLIELKILCRILDISLSDFITMFENTAGTDRETR